MKVLPEDMVALQSAVRAEVRWVDHPSEITYDHLSYYKWVQLQPVQGCSLVLQQLKTVTVGI